MLVRALHFINEKTRTYKTKLNRPGLYSVHHSLIFSFSFTDFWRHPEWFITFWAIKKKIKDKLVKSELKSCGNFNKRHQKECFLFCARYNQIYAEQILIQSKKFLLFSKNTGHVFARVSNYGVCRSNRVLKWKQKYYITTTWMVELRGLNKKPFCTNVVIIDRWKY